MAPAPGIDLERLLELVGEVHGFPDLDEFRAGVLPALKRAVPCDWASYNEVGGDGAGSVVAIADPMPAAELVAAYAEHARDHPAVRHLIRTGDGRPRRLSELVTRAQLHAMPLYTEVYGPMGVEYQISLTLPARLPLVIGLALSRGDRDFDDGEQALLDLARPHLIQAYRFAEAATARTAALTALERGLDVAGRMLVVVSPAGRVDFVTPAAERLLRARHPGWAGPRTGLPEPVASWLAHARRSPAAAVTPLVLGDGGARLLVRLLAARDGGDDVLVLEASRDGLAATDLATLGLSEREAETLRWLALGRSAADTARMMGIAERTVHKHLERVYRKLGVRSRSEAAATAWSVIGPPDSVRID